MKTISFIRCFICFVYIMPLALLIGLTTSRKNWEKVGFIYRDAVKAFTEL